MPTSTQPWASVSNETELPLLAGEGLFQADARCSHLQASFFLQDAAGLSNRTDQDSSVNTVFEILVEPVSGADFGYTWQPLSNIIKHGALALPPDQSLFQINGSTPCCIPISDRMYTEINRTQDSFAKEGKDWILTSSPVSGQLMGVCSGIPAQNGSVTPSAIFSYYGQIYLATEAEIMDPSTSPVALLIESHGNKDVAATVADGNLQADPGKSKLPTGMPGQTCNCCGTSYVCHIHGWPCGISQMLLAVQ